MIALAVCFVLCTAPYLKSIADGRLVALALMRLSAPQSNLPGLDKRNDGA